MKTRLKDKKIIIYACDEKQDQYGNSVRTYLPLHDGRLWAYVRQLSAKEYYAAAMLQNAEDMVFTINWRNDINPLDTFILYNNVWYDIQRIDTFEGYKADLSLFAVQMRAPDSEQIMPYAE